MGKSKKNKGAFNPNAVFVRYSDIHSFKWEKNPKWEPSSITEPLGYFHVYQFKCDCGDPDYSEWESADIGAAVGKDEFCENPECEGKPPLKPCAGPFRSPTPCYAAPGAFYGQFQCPNPNCKKSWTSGLAYADTYQACSRCSTWAWSYNMTDEPLYGYSGKGHVKESCEKCKDKEHPCSRKPSGKRIKGRGDWNRYFLWVEPGVKKHKKKTPKTPTGQTAIVSTTTNFEQPVEVTNKKKKRSGKKKGGALVKQVSPPPELEGKIVSIVQDLSKMAFSKGQD